MSTWSQSPLQPGDLVRLNLWRDPGLSGDFLVDEFGVVTLPLLGPRNAIDVLPSELRESIIRDLRRELRNQDPAVTLMRRVRVLGEVRAPGLYHVDATMTLGDVVALAQGITADGKLDEIRVLRNGIEVISNIDETTGVAESLRSGDQVVVPKTHWLNRYGAWIAGGIISAAAIIVAASIG